MKFNIYDVQNGKTFEKALQREAERYALIFGLEKSDSLYCAIDFMNLYSELSQFVSEKEQETFEKFRTNKESCYDKFDACFYLMQRLALNEDRIEKVHKYIEKQVGHWIINSCQDVDKFEETDLHKVIAFLLMRDVIRAWIE